MGQKVTMINIYLYLIDIILSIYASKSNKIFDIIICKKIRDYNAIFK